MVPLLVHDVREHVEVHAVPGETRQAADTAGAHLHLPGEPDLVLQEGVERRALLDRRQDVRLVAARLLEHRSLQVEREVQRQARGGRIHQRRLPELVARRRRVDTADGGRRRTDQVPQTVQLRAGSRGAVRVLDRHVVARRRADRRGHRDRRRGSRLLDRPDRLTGDDRVGVRRRADVHRETREQPAATDRVVAQAARGSCEQLDLRGRGRRGALCDVAVAVRAELARSLLADVVDGALDLQDLRSDDRLLRAAGLVESGRLDADLVPEVDQAVDRLVDGLVARAVERATCRVGARAAARAPLVDRHLSLRADHGRLDLLEPVQDGVGVVELLGEPRTRPGVLDDRGHRGDCCAHRGLLSVHG